jgi:hypothetical protein
LVDLKSVSSAINYYNTIFSINFNPGRLEKDSFYAKVRNHCPLLGHVFGIRGHASLRPLGISRTVPDELSYITGLRVKYLDPVVAPVYYINVTFVIHGHSAGTPQLTVTITTPSDLHQELAVGAKFLDAVIAPVGHVDIALSVQVNAPGGINLDLALAAKFAQGLAVPGKFLDPVIETVH